MTQIQHLPRPMQIDDLVARLKNGGTDPKEKKALEALLHGMIEIFKDERRRLSYVPDAAALAPVAAGPWYRELCLAFSNIIIDGTTDDDVKDPHLLVAFTSVLRCADDSKKAEMKLGQVMESLQKRLQAAMDHADYYTQYELLFTLSPVLDALNDAKTTGLSREKLHEPLLKQLAKLSKDKEVRLAQVASYAYEGLRGILNDEGPYKALWRHTVEVVGAGAKVAGAVTTMDPSKLFDGLVKLAELPEVIKSMVEVVKALSGLVESLSGTKEGIKALQRQKSWYVALRFADMLTTARAFEYLKALLKVVPCREDKEFLCGLLAQCENAWIVADDDTKRAIIDVIEEAVLPTVSKSESSRVKEWMKLVSLTLRNPKWGDSIQTTKESWYHLPWKKTTYAHKVARIEVQAKELKGALLGEAWKSCDVAQLYYADVAVRDHYLLRGGKLIIERLSGEELPMDQCYINLTIVKTYSEAEDLKLKADDRTSSQFSLLARLKVESPEDDLDIPLPELFDIRDEGSNNKKPRRILIRGRAGVGKTTLCKKIVHDFVTSKLWNQLFDRVLWVPMRNLKQWNGDFKAMFIKEYFPQALENDCLAQAMQKQVLTGDQNGRTLFILDGLDEISEELDLSSDKFEFWQTLLNQPNAIITSRPHGIVPSALQAIDLELETIGFLPEQVTEYVKNAFKEPDMEQPDRDKVLEIETFLKHHSLVQTLVRIPIQLDALCFTWSEDLHSDTSPTTMTALYRAIELRLWWKDIPRLGKSINGRLVTPKSIRESRTSIEIHPLVETEIKILEALAFTGLYNNLIIFQQHVRDAIYQEFRLRRMEASVDAVLSMLSFLRTSDASADASRQNYHFLHLTFQEYFAACYFVRQWAAGQPLKCLEFGPSKTRAPVVSSINTLQFLQSNRKYQARYDIFWRFVAGQIQAMNDEESLCRFFDAIEDEPRDLLGPTHQRLIMHCLSEMEYSYSMPTFDTLVQKLEADLAKWVSFECKFCAYMTLPCEFEFPEAVLYDILQAGPKILQRNIMDSLHPQSNVSERIMQLMVNRTHLGSPALDIANALFMIERQSPLKPIYVEVVADVLSNTEYPRIKPLAARILQKQPVLPGAIEKVLDKYLLDHYGESMGLSFIKKDRYESILPMDMLKALVVQLNQKEAAIRNSAARALGKQTHLPKVIRKSLVAMLKHPKEHVRLAATSALGCTPMIGFKFPEAKIAEILGSDDGADLESANSPALDLAGPAKIYGYLASHLSNEDANLRYSAAAGLTTQFVLSDEIVRALAKLVKDEDIYVSAMASGALQWQTTLPDDVKEFLMTLLKDPHSFCRKDIAAALRTQLILSEEIVSGLIARLDDPDFYVRKAVVEALQGRSLLIGDVNSILAKHLEDSEVSVRKAVAKVLANESLLSDKILEKLVARIENKDLDVINNALLAIGNQKVLSNHFMNALVANLNNFSESFDVSLLSQLGKRSTLPKETLDALLAKLEMRLGQRPANEMTRALVRLSALSEDVLRQHLNFLYSAYLRRSFKENLYWYATDKLYIDSPENVSSIGFEDGRNWFDEAIKEVQLKLGVPVREF